MSNHDDDRNGFNAAKVRWFQNLLEERGIFEAGELDAFMDARPKMGPTNGARLVAKAWVNSSFKEALVTDPLGALREMGIIGDTDGMATGYGEVALMVVENTPDRHNILVCSLCSCYPHWLLGASPSWYRSDWYRAELVRRPREVLGKFGLELPETTKIFVWDSSSDMRYMVLPQRPEGTEGMSEVDLAELVTRNGLIGTASV